MSGKPGSGMLPIPPITIIGNEALIPIHDRNGIVGKAIIDASDVSKLPCRRWYTDTIGVVWCHVVGRGKSRLALHRIILDAPKGMDVDHINHDRRDNRRCNLRICTHAQNMLNTRGCGAKSGFRGVRLMPGGSWHARIQHNRQGIHLGAFPTKEEAWAARRAAELKLRGEFAPRDVA